ncbi:MAG: TraB/GumN family protein, partial [Henriciella sp.]|uniref:TraB/GumN family protein n=1 Tax=Henriciella sp. TaxID=1968823 RepID=UPI003C763E1C
MTSSLSPIARLAGASLVALSLAACNPVDDTATDTSAATDTGETPETASTGNDRRGKEEIIAEYEEALEEARETSGDGAPAMWTLSDEDTTIHMFGTVHILRPDLEWRTPEFEAAFESADTLVLELDMQSEEGMRAMARDFQRKGLYGDGRRLSTEVDEEVLDTLQTSLQPLGLPVTVLDPMEPWMAAVTLSVLQLQKEGYDPDSGVEKVLIAEANEDGKAFGYLETASVQADIFDTMPEDVQEEFLYETALTLSETSQMLDQLVDEWADGDVEGLGVLVANP